jgi:hypothetical protein
MTFLVEPAIQEVTTTTGTGAITLGGALLGFRAFSAKAIIGDTFHYGIEAVDVSGVPSGDWEVGFGTYSATNTVTRTQVLRSSNADAFVVLAAGTKRIVMTAVPTQLRYARVVNADNPRATRKIRRARSRVLAGLGNAMAVFNGDSQLMGAGAGTAPGGADTTNVTGSFPFSIPNVVAASLNRQGVVSVNQSFFGSQGSPVAYGLYDTRLNLGANYASSGNFIMGGGTFKTTVAASTLAFTPAGTFDRVKVFSENSLSPPILNVDSGATLTLTVDALDGNGQNLRAASVTLGTHTLNIVAQTGGTDIMGAVCYDSTSSKFHVVAASCWGTTTDAMIQTSGYSALNNWSLFGAVYGTAQSNDPLMDFGVVGLGRNDCTNGVAVATYMANIRTIAAKVKTWGDCILVGSAPKDTTAGTTLAVQQTYIDALYKIAYDSDCVLIDLQYAFESFEISNPMGLYWDNTHQSRIAHRFIGELIASVIMAA